MKKEIKSKIEIAIFSMGCFWKPELLFSKTSGVLKTLVGYSGGNLKNPSYEEISSRKTGHAESVKIEFDPKKISYKELLEIFWTHHNPTTINQQGPDVGSQYRSIIFYTNEKQKKEAEKSKEEKQEIYKLPIVTEIRKAEDFYPAEEYHQKYLEKRGMKSCSF